MNNFYVYQYSDPITKLPVYIGKGTHDRANYHWMKRSTHYNKEFGQYLVHLSDNKLFPIIEKVFDKLSNYEAYLLEFKKIKEFGRLNIDKDGILFNKSIGFEYFNINPFELDEMSLIQYLNSVHFNFIEIQEDEKSAIVEDYSSGKSIQKICKKFGHGPHKIKNILTENSIQIKKRGGQFGETNGMFGKKRENTSYFLGKRHTPETLEKLTNSGKKLTIVNGVQYKSRGDAMIALNISYSTLRRLLNK